jgi:hypothetical protein
MTPAKMVEGLIDATSSVTALISKRRTHGMSPQSTQLPNIAYFETGVPDRRNGMERQTYAINCRDKTFSGALALARVVTDLFSGSASTGIQGAQGNFDIGRAYQDGAPAIVSEPGGAVYNAPVMVTFQYQSSTVS